MERLSLKMSRNNSQYTNRLLLRESATIELDESRLPSIGGEGGRGAGRAYRRDQLTNFAFIRAALFSNKALQTLSKKQNIPQKNPVKLSRNVVRSGAPPLNTDPNETKSGYRLQLPLGEGKPPHRGYKIIVEECSAKWGTGMTIVS